MIAHLGKRERVARKSRKPSRSTVIFYDSQRSERRTLKLGSKKQRIFIRRSLFSDDVR